MKREIVLGLVMALPYFSQAQHVIKEPVPGKIVGEVINKDLNATTIILSNGLKVVLKHTDFDPGDVYFALLSPTGTSEYGNADYNSAFNAPSVVRTGGVGNVSQSQLKELLTGKKVSINPTLVNTYSVFNNRAAASDLALALELTHAYVTSPQIDLPAYQKIADAEKLRFKEQVKTAATFFTDTANLIQANYNTRFLLKGDQVLEAVDPKRSLEIFKELFADASMMTAVFIGDFSIDEVKPLIEKYLGSLPSLNRKAKAKDVGIYPPTGKLQKTFYKLSGDKAQLRFTYSGFAPYSKKNELMSGFLQAELKERLSSRLKAEDPGMYGPGINLSLTRANKSYFSCVVELSCTISKVEDITAAMNDEISKLASGDALKVNLSTYKESLVKAAAETMQSNSALMAYLKKKVQYNDPIDEINSYPEIINSITPKDINLMAKLYLMGKNSIRFVLLPEKAK
jgi:zinc protease